MRHGLPSLLLLCFSLVACQPPSSIGADFLPDPSYSFSRIQDLELEVATVTHDEVPGSSPNRLIVGSAHTFSGLLRAESYFQLSPNINAPLDPAIKYTYDSLTLSLVYDGYYQYDTLQPFAFSVYSLMEDFSPPDDQELFYTSDSLPFATTPLATTTLLARPNSFDELEIRLDDELGQQLFRMLEDEAEEVLSGLSFLDFFPGIALIPTVNGPSSPIVGFTPTPELRLYYSDRGELPVESIVRTFSHDAQQRFNHLSLNHITPALAELPPEDKLTTTATDSAAIIQAGTALSARLEIMDWELRREDFKDAAITKASLRFRIRGTTLSNQEELPPAITADWVDAKNTVIAFENPAVLLLDRSFGRDTYYELDLTAFLKHLLRPDAETGEALRLSLGLSGSSATGILLESREAEAPELEVEYVKLREE